MIRTSLSHRFLRNGLYRHCDTANMPHEKRKQQTNRRKDKLSVSASLPLGGYNVSPCTGGIPRLSEACPCVQTMPAHTRLRHLCPASIWQQIHENGASPCAEPKRLPLKPSEITPRESAHIARGPKSILATHMSRTAQRDKLEGANIVCHPNSTRKTRLKSALQQEDLCAKPFIIKPAATCDCNPRQHRLIWVGAAYRLAVAALLPPLTYVASGLGYELDCLVHELDGQSYQTQEPIQPVHRQFTSVRKRRRCQVAGLTPLTYLHKSCSCSIIQTYLLVVLLRIFLLQPSLIASCDYVPPTELPRDNPRLTKALPAGKTVLVMPSNNHNRKVA